MSTNSKYDHFLMSSQFSLWTETLRERERQTHTGGQRDSKGFPFSGNILDNHIPPWVCATFLISLILYARQLCRTTSKEHWLMLQVWISCSSRRDSAHACNSPKRRLSLKSEYEGAKWYDDTNPDFMHWIGPLVQMCSKSTSWQRPFDIFKLLQLYKDFLLGAKSVRAQPPIHTHLGQCGQAWWTGSSLLTAVEINWQEKTLPLFLFVAAVYRKQFTVEHTAVYAYTFYLQLWIYVHTAFNKTKSKTEQNQTARADCQQGQDRSEGEPNHCRKVKFTSHRGPSGARPVFFWVLFVYHQQLGWAARHVTIV